MKILFLIAAAFLLANCSQASSASKNETSNENIALQTTPNVRNANQVEITVGNFTPLSAEESAKIKEDKRIEKEKLESIPDEFKRIDFKNFKYPANLSVDIVPLEDGGYEYNYPHSGGESYELNDVYYADLTGDDKKEAIVNLSVVSCGGSCDGGANIFYVYKIEQNKPKSIWHFETGSLGYGLGLKSFRVENKKIIVEEFGKCSAEEEKVNFLCTGKFAAKGVIRLTFDFNGKKIVQRSKEVIEAPMSNIMNYRAEININN